MGGELGYCCIIETYFLGGDCFMVELKVGVQESMSLITTDQRVPSYPLAMSE